MENASKALIIAGAILLAILLISLGIMIFNQAQDTVNNSGMSQAEITAFNNKFLKYEGKQRGAVVKSLINEVIASNAYSNNANRQIKFRKNADAVDTINTSLINTTNSYDIRLEYNNGVVARIQIVGTFNS